MADIRINSLPSTATSFNTDDYIAIDGASGGTRKMLAATLPLTDVTLGGTSGPSVKSSLSARAPRQGLVFDSSSHGGAPIANQPAFGTSDFTVTAWVNPVAVASNAYILASVADSASLFFTGSTVQWIANASGVISVAGGVVAGKSQLFVVTRSAGTTTYYYNGVAVSTTSSGSGNLANPIVKMGSSASGASGHFNGTISALIYNRALSASEVVALYEAGAPSGADYNSASNTSIVTSAFVNGNISGALLYDTYSGASATGFTAVKTQTSTEANAYSGNSFSVVKGQQFLVTFTCTLTSGTLPELYLSDWAGSPLYNSASPITAGSFSRVITATQSGSGVRLRFYNPTANQVNYAISGLSITRLGLLLAPDAAQAGGGLTWYDTSGNAANITLPASGVSWNVPFAGYLNSSSSLNLSAGGTNQNITLTPSGTGATVISKAETNTNAITTALNYIKIQNTSSGGTYIGALEFYTWDNRRAAGIFANRNNVDGTSGVLSFAYSTSVNSFAEGFRLNSTGNFLLGTTTDSGNGKLQLATHSSSAGGIGFGTTTSLYRYSITTLGLQQNSGSYKPLYFYADVTNCGIFDTPGAEANYSGIYFNSTANSATIATKGTIALTLDSSQNATFAGTVAIGQYTTAGAPAYAKGKLYFDTTLNKLRVGGATGWETITSV